MPKPRPPRPPKPAAQPSTPQASDGLDVTVTLTKAQIRRILRLAGEGKAARSRAALLSVGEDAWRNNLRQLEHANDPGMSRSLLRALLVLTCFSYGSWLKVKEVSDAVGTGMSTTHRYVNTFMAAGILERDPHKRLYRLVERA